MKDGDLHKNHRRRMRERYLKEGGFEAFDDHTVLEFLLYYSVPRRDTNELAHKMLNEYSGISNLLNADAEDVMKRCGVGESTAILIHMVPQLARWYFRTKTDAKDGVLDSSKKMGEYALGLLAGKKNECFFCISLDVKRRVIGADLISAGGVSKTEVYPRAVAESALKYSASGVILAHNHPSCDLLPSQDDRYTTAAIIEALGILDIEIIDHIITGGDKYFSFAEAGMIR